jgi:penicillin-binding protein 1C
VTWRKKLATGAAGAALVAACGWAWLLYGPLPDFDRDRQSQTIVDRNGVTLYEPLGRSGNRSEWVDARALPKLVANATVATEDRYFFSHRGISARAIVRAALTNLKSGRVMQGGSTITQQVAKLLLGSQKRTWRQKWRETVVALRLERKYSKHEILAMYLNLAPYGNNIRGVARASRAYFGIAPEQLTIAQAAYLAALPRRPSAFNPLRNPDVAKSRQQIVLRLLLEQKFIARPDYEHARAERLRFANRMDAVLAQHFVERVLESRPAGRVIRTTLDAGLQGDVRGIIDAQRDDLLSHGARSTAVAVLDNHTGEWLAWEGSGDYFGEGFGGAIDGVRAKRQPGSTLKPFTYALAFERGDSPATVLPDIPSHFPTAEEGVVYTPRNYDGRYRGPLRIRLALAGSENVPAVALLNDVGPASLLRLLRAAGFGPLDKTADYYGLGLTLGDAEVTLEQLVSGYSAFANRGMLVEPRMLEGRLQPATRRLVSERTAFLVTDVLSDSGAREYIFGTGGNLDFPFPVAVKTGTSQAYRDNWVIGYTRDVTVGVWVGNFDRAEMRNSTGVTGAGPIFNAVMLAAVKRVRGQLPIGDTTPIVEPPPDVESVAVCALSGARPSTWCPSVERDWLPRDAKPAFCEWHRQDDVSWPAEYEPWARANGLDVQAREAPPPVQSIALRPRVVSPANGATFLIDPTLRPEFQKVPLRAVAKSRLTWRVNERRVEGEEWALTPGKHVISATDDRGQRDVVTIWVK